VVQWCDRITASTRRPRDLYAVERLRSSAEIGSAKKEKANHVSMTGLY
jgi:hypothetical protein